MTELSARLLTTLLFAIATFAPTFAAAEASSCAAETPTFAWLEQHGARVGQIELNRENIFNESKPGERTRLYRLANRLHPRTRPEVIYAQLLIAKGDLFKERLLRESERNLRRLNFLREPNFSTTCYRAAQNEIDLVLQTRDVWTFAPLAEFSRKGGENVSKIGVEDSNFLGLGKSLELNFASDRERDSTLLLYQDPNVGFTRRELDLSASSSSDGHAFGVRWQLPFYALDSRKSWLMSARRSDLERSRAIFGEVVDRYRARDSEFRAEWGRSAGLVDGWSHRWFFGLAHEAARFDRIPGESTLALPNQRRFTYPFVRFEGIQDQFRTTSNQDQIGRTEDQACGLYYRVELGQSFSGFGNAQQATLFRGDVSKGFQLSARQSLFLNAHADARWQDRDTSQNSSRLVGAMGRYYFRQSENASFFVALSGDFGDQLDLDRELVLGGETGLRAYPFEYQRGNQRTLLTLEQRFFTDWQPLHLFQVGAAAFVDVGRISGDSSVAGSGLGTLKSVGFGLRLGSLRSARANTFHLDLAYPLDARPEDRKLAFIVETRRSF